MPITRRRLLAAATAASAGILPASPLMRSLLAAIEARAAGSDRHPLRFVFCLKSNGLWAEIVQPQGLEKLLPFEPQYDGQGRLVEAKEGSGRKGRTPAAEQPLPADAELSETLSALGPFRDRLSVLQGIDSGFATYHVGSYQTLGGFQARSRDSTETLGPTVDSLLARAFPRPVPHVCLGHDPKSPSGVAYVPTSAAAAGRPIPFYTKPKRAYKELFGVVAEGAARYEYETQAEILDFFVDDAQRLRQAVAGPEREQLDRYLDAFESLRRGRGEVAALADRLKRHVPPPPAEIAAEATMRVGAGNAEIAIAALLGGLTNVVTLRFDLLESSTYEGVGPLHSGVGHGQVKDMIGARRAICRFHFERIARIAEALRSVPEGDGTMLDNTLFVYTSDNGETHHSGGANFPIVLLGDLGGRLARGRYYAPGNRHEDRSQPGYVRLGDVWATLLAAAGQPFAQFGIPVNGVPHRPIEPLLA